MGKKKRDDKKDNKENNSSNNNNNNNLKNIEEIEIEERAMKILHECLIYGDAFLYLSSYFQLKRICPPSLSLCCSSSSFCPSSSSSCPISSLSIPSFQVGALQMYHYQDRINRINI